MRFDILQTQDNKYGLYLDGKLVFTSDKLSQIVAKMEAYVKLRFLPEPVKLSFLERVKGVMGSGK